MIFSGWPGWSWFQDSCHDDIMAKFNKLNETTEKLIKDLQAGPIVNIENIVITFSRNGIKATLSLDKALWESK